MEKESWLQTAARAGERTGYRVQASDPTSNILHVPLLHPLPYDRHNLQEDRALKFVQTLGSLVNIENMTGNAPKELVVFIDGPVNGRVLPESTSPTYLNAKCWYGTLDPSVWVYAPKEEKPNDVTPLLEAIVEQAETKYLMGVTERSVPLLAQLVRSLPPPNKTSHSDAQIPIYLLNKSVLDGEDPAQRTDESIAKISAQLAALDEDGSSHRAIYITTIPENKKMRAIARGESLWR